MFTPDEIKKARKRVKAKKDFYQHLVTFVIINCFLIAINLVTNLSGIWFHYVLLGWGIGLLFHYVEVFGIPEFDILNSEWEERELENELRKINPNSEKTKIQSSHGENETGLKLKKLEKDYDDSELV